MDALPFDLLTFSQLRQGDTVEGTIVSISPNQVLVAIPYKADAIVDPRELERLGKEFLESIAVGDPITAVVVQPEDRDGNVVISLARAQQEQDWRQAEELFQSQDVFEGVVTGYNRGGVIVRVGRVRGFVPASQLSARWQAQQDAEGDPEQRWARLVGQTMQLKVVEMDRQRNRLILSERAAMRDWRKNQKDRLLSTLNKGDVLKGIVTSIADFGAFVDLGGADGLIHLSELAWHRVEHPREILRVGQEVEVYVMNVDEERKRIGLSLRRLSPEPWSVVADRYQVGQVVTATITRLAAFGAFAKMDDCDRRPDSHFRDGGLSYQPSEGDRSGRRRGAGAGDPHRSAAPPHRAEPAPGLGRQLRRLAGRCGRVERGTGGRRTDARRCPRRRFPSSRHSSCPLRSPVRRAAGNNQITCDPKGAEAHECAPPLLFLLASSDHGNQRGPFVL